jgi:hypothetical protein
MPGLLDTTGETQQPFWSVRGLHQTQDREVARAVSLQSERPQVPHYQAAQGGSMTTEPREAQFRSQVADSPNPDASMNVVAYLVLAAWTVLVFACGAVFGWGAL